MRQWMILLILLVLAGTSPAADQHPIPEKLRRERYALADLLAVGDALSPQLAGYQAATESAEGRLRQTKLYPNPSVVIAREDTRLSRSPGSSGMSTAMVAQPVVTGAKRDAAIRAAESEVEAARQEYDAQRRLLHRNIHRSWVKLRYLSRLADLQQQLLENSGQTLAMVEELRPATNDPALLRARTEHVQDELEVVRILSEAIFAAQELDAALGGPGISMSQVTGALEEGINPELVGFTPSHVVRDHPELLAHWMMEQAWAHREREARSTGSTPDVSLMVGMAYDHRDDESLGTLGVAIPLPLWNRNQGGRDVAAAELARHRALHAETEARLRARVATALQRVNELDTLASEYARAVTPELDRALEEARVRFAAGEMQFIDLLDVQRRHHEAHARHLAYLRDLNFAYADLAELTGRTP